MRSNLLALRRALAVAGLTTALSAVAGAQTFNLDFSGFPGNGFMIPDTYGDVPGVVDVSIRHRTGWGLAAINDPHGYYWRDGYNDLLDVAYTTSGAGVGEVALNNLVGGQAIRINFADVGAWVNRAIPVELRVYDLLGNRLFGLVGNTLDVPPTHVRFAPGVTNLTGLLVQWSGLDAAGNPVDAYNVGIDNVNFTIGPVVAAVPEPATLGLLAAGLGLLGLGVARRRHVGT